MNNLILISPFSDIPSVSADFVGCVGRIVKCHFDNMEELKNYNGRLLVVHGRSDEVINCRHGEMIVNYYGKRDPSKCKFIVKSDKIVIKLAKVKQGEYGGYDYWTKLSDKKAREKSSKMKENPSSSIMDLMKQMYDEGDDNMKKIIGETMMKQQRGELGKDDPMKGLDKMDI